MLADRVAVAEGNLEDLKSGRVPNVLAERGWKAEWEHNRAGLLRRVLVQAGLLYAAFAFFRGRRAR
jgi:hypothetical protein